MMKKLFLCLGTIIIISCGGNSGDNSNKIITVSIAPFKYFVEEIAGNDFTVNIMVPAGADPHTYEPFPEQINKLRKSTGYISNGYLGFEMNWLDRFYETNRSMTKLSLGEGINPLASEHHHEGGHSEGADPHYWVSPVCAMVIAASVEKFLIELNPLQKLKYETNYQNLFLKIQTLDKRAKELFSNVPSKGFMIYHPNLAYLARDYGLEEIPVEFEGKEPTPHRMKELIDRARKDNLKTIFVQLEYDTKNAKAIAGEIGAKIILIDPLSENWLKSTTDIINALNTSLIDNSK
jgi:zinc transport system substrate-binding protein